VSVPLILDVDTGIDDALALLYAAASPDVDLLAVTCVSGNVAARQVEQNTRAVLELAGRGDVEVALGRETPLVKALEIAPDTHGPRGLGYAELPPATRPLSARHAVDVIVDAARARPGEITLVTLGPLTNLALALEHEPDLPRLLDAYVLMGGAFRTSGNTTPTSEWNVYVDPDAAKRVFEVWGAARGVDPTIPYPLAMGLDVTERARLLPEHLARLTAARGDDPNDPITRFVDDALRFYFEYHERHDGFYGAFVHDPFTVAAALDRSRVVVQPVFADIETGPGLAHGMTVADWRSLTRRAPNVEVAIDGNAAAFLDRIIDRLGRLVSGGSDVAL
jgi:purine nucleosidase